MPAPEERLAMTPAQRRQQRQLQDQLAYVLKHRDADPRVAVVALQNLMASILATQFAPDIRAQLVDVLLSTLPLYVGAYEQRERIID